MQMRLARWVAALILSCGTLACATAPKDAPKADGTQSAAAEKQPAGKERQPKITYQTEQEYLGEIIHAIGQKFGGSVVLTKGAELRIVGPVKLNNAKFVSAIDTLAKDANCEVQECDTYLFVYPDDLPGYDALAEITLAGKLDPAYSAVTTEMKFAYGTRLYNVFAMLSQVLNITIVADNAVADAQCGELTLAETPIDAALEAILKSARAVSFKVDSTPEYIFFSAKDNNNANGLLLNAKAIGPKENAALDNVVTINLPQSQPNPAQYVAADGAAKLGAVLPALSRQLGIPVTASDEIDQFPVNPVIMNHVKVRTALDLLIRQWLTTDYGYEVSGDAIVIRHRDPK